MRGYFTEGPPPSAWEPAWDRTAAATEDGFTVVERSMLESSMALGATKLSDDLTAGVSWDLKNPRAVAWLEQRTTNQVAGISETSKRSVNTVMTKAVDEGWSVDRTARELTSRFEQFAVGAPQEHIDSRAHLIAVTESASAYEQGTAQMIAEIMEAGVPMEKAWLTVGDDRVDEDCEGNEAEGWIPAEASFSDGSSEPPAHPACVPGETLVLGPHAVGATARRYEGDAILISRASGDNLTITPNHEVLTRRGWIAAGLLVKGDQLVCCTGPDRELCRIDPDESERPTRIDQVANTLRETLGVSAVEVPTAAEDFHGDGGGSEVHVVWTDSLLRHYREPTDAQHAEEGLLKCRGVADAFDGLGALTSLRNAGLAPPARNVSGLGVSTALLGATTRLLQSIPLGDTATRDAMLAQDAADDVTGDPVLLGESILRFAGKVALDDVVALRRVPFLGHVYNLQTLGGWYSANDVIVHNCRCTTLYQAAEVVTTPEVA
jgi:hypothetical protein